MDEATLRMAAEVRTSEGLLVNDSILVAAMGLAGLSVLATADRDFARVAGLEICIPWTSRSLRTSPEGRPRAVAGAGGVR